MKKFSVKRFARTVAATLVLVVTMVSAQAPEIDIERMRNLEKELRCLVCQNQSLADSAAPLAADLRAELERLMREGKTDDEIRTWMVQRYGDFVLYRPPFKPSTWALWLGPFILLALGGLFIWRMSKSGSKRSMEASIATVDPEKLRKALSASESKH